MYRRKMMLLMASALSFVVMALPDPNSRALAYITQESREQSALSYSIDPNIDSLLHTSGAPSVIVTGAGRWSQASFFTLAQTGWYPGGNIVTTMDFEYNSPPCGNPGATVPATTCETYNSSDVVILSQTYLNTSRFISWNLDGVMDPNSNPVKVDVLTVSLHELGHWFILDHDCGSHSEAVMCPNYRTKQQLFDDDKHGVTQFYGPYTGWENGFAQGFYSQRAYYQNVTGYPPSSIPELGPTSAEFGVPVPSQSKYERMAGTATGSYSYSYFTLFSGSEDNGGLGRYLRVRSGMHLHWLQYNYQQSTASIDFETTDGSTLRDSGSVDQNNVTVHPAGRGGYPTGQWLYFDVNLGANPNLVNKRIQSWLIAYDNGNNGRTGQFRIYIDDLEVVYYNSIGTLSAAFAPLLAITSTK